MDKKIPYIYAMSYHPPANELEFATIMATLGDPIRLAILGELSRRENAPLMCSDFIHLASKSNLTYHLGKMREAGIIRVEPKGTAKLVTIRSNDLNQRFPGFLKLALEAADGATHVPTGG